MSIDDFDGDWDAYTQALFDAYEEDLIYGSPPLFLGLTVRVRNGSHINGWDYAFWHLLAGTDGETEGTLIPQRCERIRWIRYLIDNAESENARTWLESGRRGTNYIIATPDFDFVVILEQRNGYFLLKTAYPEYRRSRQERRRKEFEAFRQQKSKLEPPSDT